MTPHESINWPSIAPFNWNDALKAASLHTSIAKLRNRDTPRDAVKDDIKIIAQALGTEARWIITDDSSSFYKLACAAADMAAATSASKLCPIKLEDGYDPSFFEPGRQRRLF